ncbi:MAG: c-type cytochrome biogenesis protein CcmI [Rhodospirillaceae bacterium]|nr:c-type cytochrome biogenesis protein CcmI [Rhodospirillaceae bacterium]MCY4065634.1 c-type cytochrome biogenesis protein CcmI [Rhodospirillaceae bacterium]
MIWLVAALLSLAAGAAVAWRLYPRRRAGDASLETGAAGYDLEVYRDQLRELDRDLARGTIKAAEAEAARNEIRRRALAAESREEAGRAASPQTLSRPTVALLAAAVPVLSLALYAALGRPELADRRMLTVQAPPRGPSAEDMRAAGRMTPEERQEMIRGMVEGLAERLEENPGDLAGWLRLGRAQAVLGELDKSADAYGRAVALSPDSVRVLTLYTMAVLRLRNPDDPLDPDLLRLFDRLHTLEPRHPLALYYLGRYAFERGREAEGKAYWRKLLPLVADRPDLAARIRKRLEEKGE